MGEGGECRDVGAKGGRTWGREGGVGATGEMEVDRVSWCFVKKKM